MTNDWDGMERRQPVIVAEALKPRRETVEAPVVMVLVGFAATLLMQAASLWGHGVILDHHDDEAAREAEFRRQLNCFVVKYTQGAQGIDVLTTCGFLSGGGK